MWDSWIFFEIIKRKFFKYSISSLFSFLHSLQIRANLFLNFIRVCHLWELRLFCLFLIFIIRRHKLKLIEIRLSLLVDINKLTKLFILQQINPSCNSIQKILQHFLSSLHNRSPMIQNLLWWKFKQLLDTRNSRIRVRMIQQWY